MKIREKFYESGFFRKHSLPVPVISVGNLVLGGTGKTPTVRHLAKLLLQNGFNPAIISRGYGGKARLSANVVSDGNRILLSPEQAGDEPYMLAEALPSVPVLTGKRRIVPCLLAIKDFDIDVIILDDGFQHLAIKRDIDIVLFDGTNLTGNNRVFPGGNLREPVSALHRCDAFIVTGINNNNKKQAEHFSEQLKSRFKSKPVYFASLGKSNLHCPDLPDSMTSRKGPFFAFCGIANPSRFKVSLNTMAIKQCGFLELPDHVKYKQSTMTDICTQAISLGAQYLVTTQKDFVKIKQFHSVLPRCVVEIDFQVEDSFDLFVCNSMQRLKSSNQAHIKVGQ